MTTISLQRYVIEPFDNSDDEYAACCNIINQIYPDYPDTPDDWKRWDEKRNKSHFFERYIVRDPVDGRIVAFGGVGHTSWTYHPQRFFVEPIVDPAFQGCGIGSGLYDHLFARIQTHNPNIVESFTRSDQPRAVRFLTERGFELTTREYSSELDLAQFDPTPFVAYQERVQRDGIEIVDLPELRRRLSDSWQRGLYDAAIEIEEDIPWHADFTPDPFERWIDKFESSPNRIEELFLVALDGDQIAGVTMISRKGASSDRLFTGLTGVRGAWRRKGVAIALKLRALQHAQTQLRTADGDHFKVITENEENNPMYRINERLGFIRKPDFLNYVKKLE